MGVFQYIGTTQPSLHTQHIKLSYAQVVLYTIWLSCRLHSTINYNVKFDNLSHAFTSIHVQTTKNNKYSNLYENSI